MTLSNELDTAAFPAEGEIGVVNIGPLTCENGAVIDDVSIAVQRWGELSPTATTSWWCYALTGDSRVPGWWEGHRPGAPIDTDRWCALATNVLGGCRGPPARFPWRGTASRGAPAR